MIQALVLAAGASRRMGRFKPLIPLGDGTVLARSVKTFRRSGIDSIIVVSGHRHQETAAACNALEVDCIHNPDYSSGMFSSVLAGVRALSGSCRAFFVLPVDIPLVRPWTIDRITEIFLYRRPPAAVPSFLDSRGHPPLVSAELIPAILAHDGSGGLRQVLDKAGDGGLEVDVFDRNILLDLDRPADLGLACRRLNRLGRLDREEALALAGRVCRLSPAGLAHGRAVGRTAEALTLAANRAGACLDQELAYAGGLLHDLAKGTREHELAAARLLQDMGLIDLAPIVGAHRDIELAEDEPIGERELVFLADKLVRGRQRVSLEERFREKIDLYAGDPQETAAIRRRRANARTVQARVEKLIGQDPASVLPDLTPRPLAETP